MVSVLIITKNSSDTIKDCIESVDKFVDEVIVIDGGSSDKTVEIASKLGVKVVENKFKDFSDQRNLAKSIAKNDWILYLDSDEVATPEFLKELEDEIALAAPEAAGFFIKRKTFFLGQDWGYEDRIERVFRKEKLKEWHGVVHETPVVSGTMSEIREPVLHYTHRNLAQMVDKTNEWSDFEANLRLKNNHPKMSTWRFFRVMTTGFLKSYFKEGGWRNGTAGIVESIFQAFSMFITYAKLWEKQNKD